MQVLLPLESCACRRSQDAIRLGFVLCHVRTPRQKGDKLSESPLRLSSDSGHSQETQYHRGGLACALEHGCCVLGSLIGMPPESTHHLPDKDKALLCSAISPFHLFPPGTLTGKRYTQSDSDFHWLGRCPLCGRHWKRHPLALAVEGCSSSRDNGTGTEKIARVLSFRSLCKATSHALLAFLHL